MSVTALSKVGIWPRARELQLDEADRQLMNERWKMRRLFSRTQRAKDEISARESDRQCSSFGEKQPRMTSGWQRKSHPVIA
jgi:hypothetical protein